MTWRDLLALAVAVAVVVGLCSESHDQGALPGLAPATVEQWLQSPYEPLPVSGDVVGLLYEFSEQPGLGSGEIRAANGRGLPPPALRPAPPSGVLQAWGLAFGLFDEDGRPLYVAPVGWPTRVLGERSGAQGAIVGSARKLDRGVVGLRFPFVPEATVVLFEVEAGHVTRVRARATLGEDPPALGEPIEIGGS